MKIQLSHRFYMLWKHKEVTLSAELVGGITQEKVFEVTRKKDWEFIENEGWSFRKREGHAQTT